MPDVGITQDENGLVYVAEGLLACVVVRTKCRPGGLPLLTSTSIIIQGCADKA